jgi:hypothetical protein
MKSNLYYEPVEINYSSYSESDSTNALAKLEAIESKNNSPTNGLEITSTRSVK